MWSTPSIHFPFQVWSVEDKKKNDTTASHYPLNTSRLITMTMTDGSLSHHPERILGKKVQVENHMRSDGITVQHEASNLAFGMAP